MKRILILFVSIVLSSTSALAAPGGSAALTLNPVQEGSGKIEARPLLTGRDFEKARVSPSSAKTVLELKLAPAGAKKLKAYSASHVGKALAVLLDDRVIARPTIRVPIEGADFQVDALDLPEATRIAQLINDQGVK